MKNLDELVFNINQVAKQINVVPGTIRNWEKYGLFTARRTSNNYRIYSFKDISFLKRVKELSVDKRLSYEMVKRILGMQLMEHKADRRRGNKIPQLSKKFLTRKWRTLREKSGFTLEEVSIHNLVADKTAHVKSMMYTVQPGCGNYQDHSLFGEEFVHVLSGTLEFTLNDTQTYQLSPGDSLFFHSNEKHKWFNNGETVTRAMWIYSPFRE